MFYKKLFNVEKSAIIRPNYHFFADPHVSPTTDSIRVEGIKNYHANGDILLLNKNLEFEKTIINDGKHYSYPLSFIENKKEYIMPEVASHSEPYILNSKNLKEKIILKFEKKVRLLDTTLFKKNLFYIFETSKQKDLLFLFYSNSLYKKFFEHKNSPIKIGPYGSRMAGNIFVYDKKI